MKSIQVSLGLAFTAAVVLAPAQSFSQSSSEPSTLSDDVSFTLEEVVVTATRAGVLPAQGILTSVDIAGAGLVQDANVDYAWELFGRMPGVMLTEFNQGTTSGKLSLRAFNGEGEVNAIKLLIDGVPSNSNDGNMPYIDTVFPLGIERLEVVRGTNDPRYGLHNIGGNANIVTRTGGDYQEARIGYGSWNTLDGQAAAGYERGDFSQNYVFAFHQTDGYRDHSDSKRYALSGKWFYNFGSGNRIGFSARGYKNTADEAGYLTRAQIEADPQQSLAHTSTDGGERKINQLSAYLDVQLSEALTWSNIAYRNVLDDQRFVRFSAAVSQQERDADETHVGVKSTMTLRPEVQSWSDLSFEWGADAEWQDNLSTRYSTANRQRVTQTRHQHFTFDVYGVYAQAVLKPVEWLKLVPAFRTDTLEGDFDNRLSGVTAPMYDYGWISQPKFSAVVSLGRGYNLYANWGRTYQVGVTAASYKIPPLTNELKPSINTGWETGLKFAPSNWLNGRIAYWRQTATNEWRRILNSPSGDSENVGETLRKGFDIQFNLQPSDLWSLWLAYAHQDSEILNPGATALNTLGKEIDHVPHHVVSGGVDYQMLPALKVSLELNGQSNYWLERTNSTDKFGDFMKLSLSAQYQVNDSLLLEGQIKNLTDQYSEYVWWDTSQTPAASMHSPADPRSYFVSARFKF